MNTITVVNKSVDTGLKIILIVLGLIFVVGIVLLIVFERHYNDCKNLESPLCLTGNCPAPSEACGNQPFKKNSDGSGYVCKPPIIAQPDVPKATF
jgi:uncharacterized membrane protein affecting hemolysin expression